jgi:hypothetical protein
LGTILSTIGIASVSMSGGEKQSAPARPLPVAEDKSIVADSAEEADL